MTRALDAAAAPAPAATRYQGSKLKLLDWLWSCLKDVPFETCLDAFCGSGCVAHFLKARGKRVTANDQLASCMLGARALVENQEHRLSECVIDALIQRQPAATYDDFISRTFDGIYFTAEENAWLDVVSQNIAAMTPGVTGNPETRCRQAIAYHALFQAALAKRPYNLFHRRNLYMRLAAVERSFGNKTTWDRPFESHFRQFAAEAGAAVFPGPSCIATQADAIDVAGAYDLVYIDPPYLNARGGGVDYLGFYHFLEGLADYAKWHERINYGRRHRPMRASPSPWARAATIEQAFIGVFERFADSTLAVSYRSDGIPSPNRLVELLGRVKPNVAVHTLDRRYTYALSVNRRSSEILLVGTS